MTNEELAHQIKAGNDHLQEQLWLQIESFVAQRAYKYATVSADSCSRLGVELNDFIQVGYFAMIDAVKAFPDETEYKFTTFLGYQLRRHFGDLIQVRGNKSEESRKAFERITGAESLDVPISDDLDSRTLAEMIPDPRAEEAFENVEEQVYLEKLRADLNKALSTLTPRQALCVRQFYLEGKTQAAIAKSLNVTETSVKDRRQAGLAALRRCANLQDYRTIQYAHAYQGGFNAWKRTDSSIQERIVMNIESREQALRLHSQGKTAPSMDQPAVSA